MNTWTLNRSSWTWLGRTSTSIEMIKFLILIDLWSTGWVLVLFGMSLKIEYMSECGCTKCWLLCCRTINTCWLFQQLELWMWKYNGHGGNNILGEVFQTVVSWVFCSGIFLAFVNPIWRNYRPWMQAVHWFWIDWFDLYNEMYFILEVLTRGGERL